MLAKVLNFQVVKHNKRKEKSFWVVATLKLNMNILISFCSNWKNKKKKLENSSNVLEKLLTQISLKSFFLTIWIKKSLNSTKIDLNLKDSIKMTKNLLIKLWKQNFYIRKN